MTQLQSLRDECLAALGNYASQAQKTCELLGEMEGRATSLDRLLAVVAQTQLEDEVQHLYLELRQRLFDFFYRTEFPGPEPVRALGKTMTKAHEPSEPVTRLV
jgi:hypothetical protein